MKESNKIKAIQMLYELGFIDDGATEAETVKTFNNSTNGHMLMTFPERVRMKLPDTFWKATIGERTTCIYHIESASPTAMQNIDTKNIEAIKEFIINHCTKEDAK